MLRDGVWVLVRCSSDENICSSWCYSIKESKDRNDRQNLFEQRSLRENSKIMDLIALSLWEIPLDSLKEHVRKTDALARKQRGQYKEKKLAVSANNTRLTCIRDKTGQFKRVRLLWAPLSLPEWDKGQCKEMKPQRLPSHCRRCCMWKHCFGIDNSLKKLS